MAKISAHLVTLTHAKNYLPMYLSELLGRFLSLFCTSK
jgi:hypothetical protein